VKRRTPQLKRRIGYVPELHHLYGWMTVQEIIQFVSTFYGTWDAGLCDQLLSLFELPPDKKVKSLSKGMTAKLGLLLALAHRPELLILDEPTSGLDPLAREEFLDGVLRAGGQTDQTVLFSSHQVDDVERIADEIGIMAQGRLVIHQSVDSVRNDVKRIRAVLQDGSLPQHVPPETMWQAINRREWTLTVYPFRQGTLDDVVRNNPVVNAEVIDISLEDIFKDVVRGQKEGAARGPTT